MQALREVQGIETAKGLTERQSQVLELIAKRQTLKQVAAELAISESAVNQHVKALKSALGVNSLAELAETHRTRAQIEADGTYRKSACRNSGLHIPENIEALPTSERLGPVVSFHEALSYRLEAPWEEANEPIVVPGVLNGTNARLVRATLIVGIALGLFILVLVGLGVTQGISNAIPGGNVPSTN